MLSPLAALQTSLATSPQVFGWNVSMWFTRHDLTHPTHYDTLSLSTPCNLTPPISGRLCSVLRVSAYKRFSCTSTQGWNSKKNFLSFWQEPNLWPSLHWSDALTNNWATVERSSFWATIAGKEGYLGLKVTGRCKPWNLNLTTPPPPKKIPMGQNYNQEKTYLKKTCLYKTANPLKSFTSTHHLSSIWHVQNILALNSTPSPKQCFLNKKQLQL